MTLEEMKEKKREYGYSYQQLSERSGVPVGTLQKIFRGETTRPRYETLQALAAALGSSGEEIYETSDPGLVRETAAYGIGTKEKKQGEYTLEDYYALPEDQRFELIDGVLYEMNAPVPFHQLAAGEIHRQIANFLLEREGSCMPFISPIDVQLDEDNRTMVQPDVIILCDRNRIWEKNIFGAPDFALEIISPSTKRKDYTLKLRKYEMAGVREYWLVDPYQKVIIVYFFESETSPTIYPIDAEIPVNLYGGELTISIRRLMEWLPQNGSETGTQAHLQDV